MKFNEEIKTRYEVAAEASAKLRKAICEELIALVQENGQRTSGDNDEGFEITHGMRIFARIGMGFQERHIVGLGLDDCDELFTRIYGDESWEGVGMLNDEELYTLYEVLCQGQ